MKVLVCSAWPYGYGMPHLGNLMSSLLSGDVFARYYRMRGYDTLYVSGTDMHGARAEFEAKKLGLEPAKLLDKNHKKLKKLIKEFGIDFDNYTSTESENHKEFVREIYEQMEKNGYIKTASEKRAYCGNCQMFLADDFIEGKCPRCDFEKARGNQCDKCGSLLEPEQLIKPHCNVCGKSDIIFKETKHWYLDLEKLQPKILDYIKLHPEWQNNVKGFTENFVKEGLKPRAVTRDLKWGIPAPFEGAENKVIYVWAEAALGYVSATKEISKEWKSYWFGDVKQIYTIGKDNIPFHTIIFPGQLMASGVGYHLPDQIAATEYLNWEGGKKFSKSRGVGIFMDNALELMPASCWRFYLMYDRPESKDTEFSWAELDKTCNQILIGNFGNFVNRTLVLLKKFCALKLPEAQLDQLDKEMLDLIEKTKMNVENAFERGSLREALEKIMGLCTAANAYLQQREPWKNEALRLNTLLISAQISKALAIFLYPFIPSVSQKLWKILNLKGKITWKALETDFKKGHQLKEPEILLEKIDIKKIRAEYDASQRQREVSEPAGGSDHGKNND